MYERRLDRSRAHTTFSMPLDNQTTPLLGRTKLSVVEPVFQMNGIVKHFPGVHALKGVDLEVFKGEVHVLFGENGAGKSTLINIIAGTFPPDEGKIVFDGEAQSSMTAHRARELGVSAVFQEFSLAPDLTIEENLLLGREATRFGLLRKAKMREQVRAMLAELDFDLSPNTRVGVLTRAEQQMTEIAKALLGKVKLLILDEPTSSLTERETEKLFAIIAQLKHHGVGIIYVSHRLGEIKRIGDRLTVLRDGAKIGTVAVAKVDEEQLVEMMTGRAAEVLFPRIEHRPQEEVLRVRDLSTASGAVRGVDLYLRAGEVVGLAGLVGCGKSELARALFGLEVLEGGRISLFGRDLQTPPTPASMLASGVCYFPSDRVAEGLALVRPLRENVSMAALKLSNFSWHGLLRLAAERIISQEKIQQLQVRPADAERPVELLSGGNRQKVMLSRGIIRDVKVFLFDEPTVGIDVGAKVEIYRILAKLQQQGAAILVASSELPELLHLSSRVYVMNRGKISAELQGDDIREDVILSNFFDREGTTFPRRANAH